MKKYLVREQNDSLMKNKTALVFAKNNLDAKKKFQKYFSLLNISELSSVLVVGFNNGNFIEIL